MGGFRLCACIAALLAVLAAAAGCEKKHVREPASKSPAAPVAAGNLLADERDGKTYRTVTIGDMVWTAENLNYAAEDSSRCYVRRDDANTGCVKYGRLYSWKTALSICPKGWRLPTDAEWQALTDSAGGRDIAGKNLRAKSGWRDGAAGDDPLGFSAMPGGGVLFVLSGDSYDYKYAYEGSGGFWWSASAKNAYWVTLDYTAKMDRSDGTDYNGGNADGYFLSVRCVQEAKWRVRVPSLRRRAAPKPHDDDSDDDSDADSSDG